MQKTYSRQSLPKWAQEEFDRLERDVKHYRDLALEGPEETNTTLIFLRDEKPLPNDGHVRFYFGEVERDDKGRFLSDGWIDIRMSRDRDEGQTLRVMASELLDIAPQASNTIRLRPRRFRR